MEDKIFNNDPIFMKNAVGKQVTVETIENRYHSGIVYVIDPISKTLVLAEEDTKTIEFIFYNAIKSFNITNEKVDEKYLKKNTTFHLTEDVQKHKQTLIKWFKQMFINVEECGDSLKVEEHLRIDPPFGIHDCMCDNTIILERIRNLIQQMPKDFV